MSQEKPLPAQTPPDSEKLPDRWVAAFESDIRQDSRAETLLAAKEWLALALVYLLVLIRRLFI